MPSDIRLVGEGVVVLANDLMLDFADRRGDGAAAGLRRALTHDHTDGLTLNWDRDYPGGVTILGTLTVPDRLSAGHAETNRLVLHVRRALPEPSRAESPPVLEGAPDRRKPDFKRLSRTEINLETELRLLWDEVLELRERVRDLEASG